MSWHRCSFMCVDFKRPICLVCGCDCVESSGGGAGPRVERQAIVLRGQTVCCSVHRPGASCSVKRRQRNRHEDPGIHTRSPTTSSCFSPPALISNFSYSSSQYPGVAESIHSDINNLMSVLKMSVVLPEGNDCIHIYFGVCLCPPDFGIIQNN